MLMRRLQVAVVLLLLPLAISCGDEYAGFENPSSPGPVTLPQGSMSATVNGVAWNADDQVQASIGPANSLQVSASDKNAWTSIFNVNNSAVGTQTFVAARGACNFSNTTGNFRGTNGSVTIITLTAASVAGTFDCGTLDRSDTGGGARTMTVTNGRFDIKF